MMGNKMWDKNMCAKCKAEFYKSPKEILFRSLVREATTHPVPCCVMLHSNPLIVAFVPDTPAIFLRLLPQSGNIDQSHSAPDGYLLRDAQLIQPTKLKNSNLYHNGILVKCVNPSALVSLRQTPVKPQMLLQATQS